MSNYNDNFLDILMVYLSTYLPISDIITLSNRKDLIFSTNKIIKNCFNKQYEEIIYNFSTLENTMLKCCTCDCSSYRIIVDSLENVPKYREPEDHENWIIPIHNEYCLSCYADILYNWFSNNNNRICILSDYQDPLLYAYKFKDCMEYHNKITSKLSEYVCNDLVSLLIRYYNIY